MDTAIDLPHGIAALVVFAFGACVGSFVGVVAYRLPREISIVAPRSFCPSCGKPIPVWTNVPIFAYLGLRARCLACKAKIPFRYFLTELALGSAALYLYVNFPPLDGFARFVLCAALFATSLIDYDWRVIPNAVTIPGIAVGILTASWVMPEVGWESSLAGIALGAGFLFFTGEAYWWIRGREGIGMGDVWLLGMIGAFLGWTGALFTLFGGSVLGTVAALIMALSGEQLPSSPEPIPAALAEMTGNTLSNGTAPRFLQTAIPFGPFLSIAAGIFTLFQPALMNWYLR